VSAREEEGFHREHRGLREEEETRRNRMPQIRRLCVRCGNLWEEVKVAAFRIEPGEEDRVPA
jgi:hypothetical protein